MTGPRDGIPFETSEHALITGLVASGLGVGGAGQTLTSWRASPVTDDDGNYTDATLLELPSGRRYLVIVRPVDDDDPST